MKFVKMCVGIMCLVPMIGCSGDGVGPAASPPSATTLPPPSSIPPGIYSGSIDVHGTAWIDGVLDETNDSLPFTLVFDDNGRLLDADGVPFLVGGVYGVDVGTLFVESFARSIIVIDNRIVLRFDLTVRGDVGTGQIEMTGSQTDTITLDADTGTLTFVRTQQYGGIGANGVSVTILLELNAILDRG